MSELGRNPASWQSELATPRLESAVSCGLTSRERSFRPLPHVLYVIDELCRTGGAERSLIEITRRLTPDRFSCSIATFRVDPEFGALGELPCQLHLMPLRRTWDVSAMRTALSFRRLILEHHVGIVHTFFETSDLWAAPIAKLSGCRILISSRRDMGIFRKRKHELAYPLVNRFFDRVLAVSHEVRGYCLEHDQLPPERVETLHNGVDLEGLAIKGREYEAREKLHIEMHQHLIVTVGNIRPVKGIDVLIRAAALVRREFPKALFLVVGAPLISETFDQIQRLVTSFELQNNVKFAGSLANPYPVLRTSDVFCLPSRNEGFSNALLEAMAFGLPCVATRVGGNGEALSEGVSGYLLESEDFQGIADRILRLLRDPQLRRRMGNAAREKVQAHFTVQRMAARLMDIYDELLTENHV